MKYKNIKIKITILMTLITLLLLANFSFGFWFIDEKEDNFKWINKDFSFPKGTWLAIDEDGDGFGYNYYFDDKISSLYALTLFVSNRPSRFNSTSFFTSTTIGSPS